MSVNFGFPVNTIDFATNKGEKQKPPTIKIEGKKIAVRYSELNIVVLRPAIDRLTFGFSPDQNFLNKYSPGTTLSEYKDYIKASLYHEGKCNYEGLSMVAGVSFKKQPYASYKVNLRYKPPSSDESVLIQIEPKGENSKKAFIRFDMNPRHFSQKAIEEFHAFITDKLLTMPGHPVPYDEFLIWCPIYRADVCVDVLGARPGDLEVWPVKGKKVTPEKSHTYKSKTGRTETVYPKAKKGHSATEYVYDKRQEMLDTKKEPIYGDFLHSRYESRIQKTTFHKLANIKNRCNRISVRALDIAKFDKLHHTHKLFIRYVLARNLEKALALIPADQQEEYKQVYEDHMLSIWDTKKLWSYWKDTLASSGLFPKA